MSHITSVDNLRINIFQKGDVVECEIDEIGKITNIVQ